MLAIVAPTSMSIDQQTVFLQAALKALDSLGINAEEVAAVAPQVIAKVVRHQQIVHEISEAVSEKRARNRRISDMDWHRDSSPLTYTPVMDRRGEPMSEADTAQLNEQLAAAGATARYRQDGSRFRVDEGGRFICEMSRPWRRVRELENEAGVPPLTRAELDRIPERERGFGIKLGYLKLINGMLVETEVRS
jgi:hypothetical protein